MRIHKEGHTILWLVWTTLAVFNGLLWRWSGWHGAWLWVVSGLSGTLGLFVLQFFRHPRLRLSAASNVVYAPAEGKIVDIQETTEPECIGARCRQLSIFMSPFNVHVNRAPIAGVVEYFRYHAGKYLVAYHPKSSIKNERTTLLFRHESGQRVVVRQIAGLVARRICHYVQQGDKLRAGEEFGFIRFGSRVDVFLPLDARVLVQKGQRTSCGKTPLALLPVDEA